MRHRLLSPEWCLRSPLPYCLRDRLDRYTRHILSTLYAGITVVGALGEGIGVRPDTALGVPDTCRYVDSAAKMDYAPR